MQAQACGCTLRKVQPVGALVSSFRSANHSPEKAIDGDLTTSVMTKTAEAFPWIAIQISEDSLQLVRKVVVVNYGNTSPTSPVATAAKLKNMEVRVATMIPKSSSEKFTGGHLLGTFKGPGKPGEVVEMSSSKG